MKGRVVIGSRSDAELQARAMIDAWLKEHSAKTKFKLIPIVAARSPARFILEIDKRRFLTSTVDHDKAGVQFFDGPGRREAAFG